MIQNVLMQNRYERQISLEGFGIEGQKRLSNAVVALIGVGGVGCSVLPLLAGAGIGRIMVFDCDSVCLHNLHRQTAYSESEVGMNKARLAAEKFSALNSDVQIEAHDLKVLNDGRSSGLLSACDICIDSTDSFHSRLSISSVCRSLGMRLIMASAEGYISQRICFGNGFYLDDMLFDPLAAGEPAKCRSIFPPAAHLSGVLAASSAMLAIVDPGSYNCASMLSFDHLTSKFTVCRFPIKNL